MADTRLIRRRRGPVTLVLRVAVVVYLFLLVAWPVSLVFDRAFRASGPHEGGVGAFLERLGDPAAVYAFNLTLTVALYAVIANTVFGVGISLLLVRYRFVGRRVLSVLVDLPLSVSPVVVGLALVLAYSSTTGWLGGTLQSVGFQVIFSTPGLVLATAFVSLPLVVREVVPVLEEIGTEAEQAARSLGANGRQVFWRITLPSIKWALVYGVVLTTARSLGEFGAVKIVSSGAEFRGETATLFVHNHYQNFDEPAAYAVAMVLVLVSVVALAVVTYVRPREERA
ncbi:sulfate ABC transporter permease subunit [Nocardioides zeae]|uniref:Sulfate ABC transporter permease subunit n=1 Tax=Nocardioides imazamoxiresistens TaxID=3231893 RepID=A0ABU3Q022_9ACTN|nr:sulfate ABC transporter permease subunit [Nocardioides zeae]MDT9594858.1 sulfate ABC transporter permease subunit [Nocardioides zeae]